MTNKMGDMGKKLEVIDSVNRTKTQQTVKELKDEMIGEAKEEFKKEKLKYSQALNKLEDDTSKQIDTLRSYLKTNHKQRQEQESKLKIMIQNLTE